MELEGAPGYNEYYHDYCSEIKEPTGAVGVVCRRSVGRMRSSWMIPSIMCQSTQTISHRPTTVRTRSSAITDIYYDTNSLTRIVSLFLAADLARTAVGLLITLARQSGTRCQMNLEILTILMVLSDSWKRFFSAVTSVTTALEVFWRDALYKSTFHVLTYLHTWTRLLEYSWINREHTEMHKSKQKTRNTIRDANTVTRI